MDAVSKKKPALLMPLEKTAFMFLTFPDALGAGPCRVTADKAGMTNAGST